MAAACATLVCLFGSFGGATALFRDSDAGWHIRNGEAMIATGHLPKVDAWSFSRPGEEWFAWEWGSDLLVGAIHGLAGLGGVATLYGLLIAASVWMWFRLGRALGASFFVTALLAAPMIVTSDLHWLARPHIFGWLFAIGAVWWSEAGKSGRSMIAIPLVAAIWTNLHGSFVLAPIILFAYACGAWLESFIWDLDWDLDKNRAARCFAGAGLATLGTLANPWGVGLHVRVFSYLTDSELLSRVGEFQSFNFHGAGAGWVMAALLFAMLGAGAALATRRLDRFFITVLLVGAGLVSARSLPLVALVALPLAAAGISDCLVLATGLRPELRRKVDRFLRYGDSLQRIDRSLHGFAWLPFVIVATFAAVRTQAAFPAADFPVQTASAVPANARLFATDKFGGYLVYRFAGERKVFFDGRSDFYGANFVKEYASMIEVRPGWDSAFAKWNFTHALLPVDSPLRSALGAQGWRQISRDRASILLERPSAR